MDALYTGRGPVCGITMRRGAGTIGLVVFAAADSAAIALTAPAAPPPGAPPACGAASACSVAAAAAAGASATGAATAAGALTAIFSSRAAGAACGFTTTPAGGGATTTTGRAGTAPAAGLATTAPTGGRETMAGVDGGGATMGGAERGCGTILRGSGLAGGAAAAGFATIGAAAAVAAGFAGAVVVGFAGIRAWRASSSSSFFLAWIAFSTSPGLEMCDRSILGATGSAPWRVCALPACDAVFASRAKCARTFSASSSSSELECVFPLETPSSGRTSRIARDLTSSSFARSLIRTLLIRLFSVCAAKRPLVAHIYPMALAVLKTFVIVQLSRKNAASLRAALFIRPLFLYCAFGFVGVRLRNVLGADRIDFSFIGFLGFSVGHRVCHAFRFFNHLG